MKKKEYLFSWVSYIKSVFLISILSTLILLPVGAQNRTKITGIITDPSSVPVIGANISVKGTKVRAISDLDGKYFIEAENGDKIVISYIGFDTKEVIAGKDNTSKIVLTENDK